VTFVSDSVSLSCTRQPPSWMSADMTSCPHSLFLDFNKIPMKSTGFPTSNLEAGTWGSSRSAQDYCISAKPHLAPWSSFTPTLPSFSALQRLSSRLSPWWSGQPIKEVSSREQTHPNMIPRIPSSSSSSRYAPLANTTLSMERSGLTCDDYRQVSSSSSAASSTGPSLNFANHESLLKSLVAYYSVPRFLGASQASQMPSFPRPPCRH